MKVKHEIKALDELSYYQNLDFDNFYSWKEKDISHFLIFHYFNAVKNAGHDNILDILIKSLYSSIQRYNKYKFALNFLDKIFLKIHKRNKGRNQRILFEFEDKRYLPMLSETRKHYQSYLILSGKKERLFAWNNFVAYIGINDLYQFIYNYLMERKIQYLKEFVRKTEEKLALVNPDYIILNSDDSPIERAIILASKRLGITIINIQSAFIFQSYPILLGNTADYILVWGEYFKNLYINQGKRKPEEIYILGYPYPIHENELTYKKNKDYIVYYLGQNYEKYNKELLDIKIKTIKELNKICQRLGLKFIYRFHPGDDREMLKNKIPEICFTNQNEKLTETIRNGDIFISFNSTSLIEASIRSKLCLQLMNYPLNTDNFEKLGARVESFQTIEQLDKYLKELVRSSLPIDKFLPRENNYFVKTLLNPSQRFLEILKDIDKKRTTI